jgi:hypothetical protein
MKINNIKKLALGQVYKSFTLSIEQKYKSKAILQILFFVFFTFFAVFCSKNVFFIFFLAKTWPALGHFLSKKGRKQNRTHPKKCLSTRKHTIIK